MEFPKLTEKTKVKIFEAHNVFFNCNVYNPHDNEDSSFKNESEGESEESEGGKSNIRQKGAKKASIPVQTESDESCAEPQKLEIQAINSMLGSKQSTKATEYFEPSQIPSEFAGLKNNESFELFKNIESRNMDKLSLRFQHLRLLNKYDTLVEEESLVSWGKEIADNDGKVQKRTKETRTEILNNNIAPNQNEDNTFSSIDSQEGEGNFTSLELFASLIEKTIPHNKEEGATAEPIKVIILHSDADSDVAQQLLKRLRENVIFWASANYELEALMNVCSIDHMKAAIDWADIQVPLISNTWLNEINNVSSSNRSTSSINARYTFQLIQANYMSSGCTNFKIISVVREGTRHTFRECPEIRNAILVMRDYEKFEKTIINFHRVGKMIRKSHLSKTSSVKRSLSS